MDSCEKAAVYVHEWMGKPSLLREVLSGLSDGGGFFTADVSLRVLDAFIQHGGGDVGSMKTAAAARGGVHDAPTPKAVGSSLLSEC